MFGILVDLLTTFAPKIVDFFTDRPDNNDLALAPQYEQIELAQLKLKYLQHQESINLQAEEAKLDRASAKELQEFIQLAENARQQKNLEFQRWRVQQEKALQLELFDRDRALQKELAAERRQTSLKVVEEQKRLENSPIWLVAADILNSHSEDKLIPLRVFFAPPKLQFDRLINAKNNDNNFPNIEFTLAEGLRQFFGNYSNNGRNIDFLAGAWVSKPFHSEASIKALF